MAEIKDFARMCNAQKYCSECPIGRVRNAPTCTSFLCQSTDEADRIITEWCKEHPEKTYAEDFLEKFPDARQSSGGVPEVQACAVYGDLPEFEKHCDCGVDCVGCWKEVIPDA